MKDDTENEFLENPEDIKPTATQTAEEIQDDILLEGLTGKTWKGKPLEPFSYGRERALMPLAKVYKLTPEQLETAEKTGYYDGVDTDPILFLYILSCSADEAVHAWRFPDQAFLKAMRLGEKEGIFPGTPEYLAAYKLMLMTLTEAAKAKAGRFQPADGGKVKKGKKRGN